MFGSSSTTSTLVVISGTQPPHKYPQIPGFPLHSRTLPRTTTFPGSPHMSWQADVDELKRRADIARQMGGPDAVAFHKGRGKLTVRERLDLLADHGTFSET